MHLRDFYTNIPPLKVGSEEIIKNNVKARTFLEIFFLKIVDLEKKNPAPPLKEIS